MVPVRQALVQHKHDHSRGKNMRRANRRQISRVVSNNPISLNRDRQSRSKPEEISNRHDPSCHIICTAQSITEILLIVSAATTVITV